MLTLPECVSFSPAGEFPPGSAAFPIAATPNRAMSARRNGMITRAKKPNPSYAQKASFFLYLFLSFVYKITLRNRFCIFTLISSIYTSSYNKRPQDFPMRPNLSSNRSGIHLWLLLWKATKAVETQAHRSVRATGLCLSDFGVLEALLHKGPLPVSALGKKVLLTSGSMTAAVDRLERRGWVERRFTASDRRSRIVCLTAQGAKLIRQVFAGHAHDMEAAFSSLDKPEKEVLANLLRKLGHTVEARTVTKGSRIQNQQASKERR